MLHQFNIDFAWSIPICFIIFIFVSAISVEHNSSRLNYNYCQCYSVYLPWICEIAMETKTKHWNTFNFIFNETML